MNLLWSLKPIFIWLTICTGLDFDRSKKKKNIRRWFLRVHSLFLFIFYTSFSTVRIAENIIQLKSYHNSTNNVGDSMISFWNRKITWALIHILCIGFNLSVFVSALVKWKPLWKKIKLVQFNFNYPATSYRQLRRESFIGLLLLSTVIPSHFSNTVLV